jgi:molybdopterin-guanine dinucleotide biosynthesis adapter protein
MKVFGFTGWSGSGKTTLIEQLIPRFVAAGLKVSLIKHAHKGFDIDRPGKDSFRLREAGCSEVLLTSENRWVMMHELRGAPQPTLEEHLALFSDCDLVLVEGFKSAALSKLEVYRPALGKPPVFQTVENVVAVATDAHVGTSLPCLRLDDYDGIADFVLRFLQFR